MSANTRRAAAFGLAASLLLGVPAVAGAHPRTPDPVSDEAGTDGKGADVEGTDGKDSTFTPRFAASDCPVALPPAAAATVSCGYVTVPLEHDEPAGETIELAVATFEATAPSDAAPLVMLAGGPGELLVTPVLEGIAGGAGGINPALHEARDFVLLDQRGVGASRPSLGCPEVFTALTTATDLAALARAVPDAYGDCRDRLVAEGVDLSAYDTENDVHDVDMVRQALGYEQVHLFGTSYGARLALQVAGEHPDGLASLVLSSPVPAEENFLADAGASYDRALRELDEACSLDAACAAFAPDLLATFEATLAELQQEPARVPYTDPATGELATISVDGATLSQVVYGLFYVPGGPAILPAVIAAAAEGDFSLLLTTSTGPASAPIAYGLQASFICAEEAVESPPWEQPPPETLAARLLLAVNPVLGEGLEQVCEVWDVEPASPETFEPVHHDVPTLVVTGQFDQITPPAYGEAVAAALPDATYVEIPGVGHSPLLNVGECGAVLLLAFLADPGAELDTSCLPAAPTFLPPDQVVGERVVAADATAVAG